MAKKSQHDQTNKSVAIRDYLAKHPGSGNKRQQVCNGINAPKVAMMCGLGHQGIDVLSVLDNGRRFLKQNLPSLVDESDEDWATQLVVARAEQQAQ